MYVFPHKKKSAELSGYDKDISYMNAITFKNYAQNKI